MRFKTVIWAVWIAITLGVIGYFGNTLFYSEDKQDLLIGDASHGHFQIEMACTACHVEPFGGEDVLQGACMNCHEQELKEAHDSHPRKKFTDPRNADRLDILDARYCVTCHAEHQEEQTRSMGVTLPDDYCYHCHVDVVEERESHKDLAFDSCASAGCHNYHDNRALYEKFLVENSNQAWLKEIAKLTQDTAEHNAARLTLKNSPQLLVAASVTPEFIFRSGQHWDDNRHLEAGINCAACHQSNDLESNQWLDKPGIVQCQQCHVSESESYQKGKHGMRLAQDLPGVDPQQARLEFKPDQQSEHGCTSCHAAHEFDTQFAATAACLSCHADEHSKAFPDSPHANIAPSDTAEPLSCASCHMPRVATELHGKKVFSVQHNQNDNLRPNEKMIRSVCMDCHGLAFSIDALADEGLIQKNFSGKPKTHIPSIDWAQQRN